MFLVIFGCSTLLNTVVEIVFSDVAGIKELQFRTTINSIDVLNRYYEAN